MCLKQSSNVPPVHLHIAWYLIPLVSVILGVRALWIGTEEAHRAYVLKVVIACILYIIMHTIDATRAALRAD